MLTRIQLVVLQHIKLIKGEFSTLPMKNIFFAPLIQKECPDWIEFQRDTLFIYNAITTYNF